MIGIRLSCGGSSVGKKSPDVGQIWEVDENFTFLILKKMEGDRYFCVEVSFDSSAIKDGEYIICGKLEKYVIRFWNKRLISGKSLRRNYGDINPKSFLDSIFMENEKLNASEICIDSETKKKREEVLEMSDFLGPRVFGSYPNMDHESIANTEIKDIIEETRNKILFRNVKEIAADTSIPEEEVWKKTQEKTDLDFSDIKTNKIITTFLDSNFDIKEEYIKESDDVDFILNLIKFVISDEEFRSHTIETFSVGRAFEGNIDVENILYRNNKTILYCFLIFMINRDNIEGAKVLYKKTKDIKYPGLIITHLDLLNTDYLYGVFEDGGNEIKKEVTFLKNILGDSCWEYLTRTISRIILEKEMMFSKRI